MLPFDGRRIAHLVLNFLHEDDTGSRWSRWLVGQVVGFDLGLFECVIILT